MWQTLHFCVGCPYVSSFLHPLRQFLTSERKKIRACVVLEHDAVSVILSCMTEQVPDEMIMRGLVSPPPATQE